MQNTVNNANLHPNATDHDRFCLCLCSIMQHDQSHHLLPPAANHTTLTTKIQIDTPWHIFSLPKTWKENSIQYQSGSEPYH